MNYVALLAFTMSLWYIGEAELKVLESSSNSMLSQDVKNELNTKRQRRSSNEKPSYIFFDNRSGQNVKLFWREMHNKTKIRHYFKTLAPGKTLKIDTFDCSKWVALEATTGRQLRINNRKWMKQPVNTRTTRATWIITRPGQTDSNVGERFVKTLVVVDKSVQQEFSKESSLKTYIKTLVHLATKVYQHKSLTQHGVKIHIILSKIILLKNEMKFKPTAEERNLVLACDLMNKLGNGIDKFDHKLFLTRNSFSKRMVGGYARKGTMCSQSSSCSIVKEHGFQSAFLIAHEIAHSFGAEDKDFPQSSGKIMARMVDSKFNHHSWSTESQQSILATVREHDCLDKKPSEKELKNAQLETLPGVPFSYHRQCQLEYEKAYTPFLPTIWNPFDPCEVLKCRMGGKWSHLYKYTGSPALDGTKCGDNKWCIAGSCERKVNQNHNILSQ